MSQQNIERRLISLEQEVAELKKTLNGNSEAKPWWERIAGQFAGDSHFEEAMRLGRKYRESTKPKPRRKALRREPHGDT
jgi:hypothetical protein